MAEDKVKSNLKLVLIAGSAGSLEVLMKILPRLESLNGYAMVIILHRKTAEDSTLEELISIKTTVPVRDVEDKTKLESGFIYIAPSDYHLLFEKDGYLSLDISERVNYSRPSIDVSFESAADAYGSSVIGILLSGANADGTNGLQAIKSSGGIVIIQDPKTAEIPFMPQNAILYNTPDYVLSPDGITSLLASISF